MTVQARAIRQRGTFDEERAEAVTCRCGRRVTGTHPCQAGAPCPWQPDRPIGLWGVVWADLEQDRGAE